MKIVRDSTGIVTAKLLAEQASPQADLVWGLAATNLLVAGPRATAHPLRPQANGEGALAIQGWPQPPQWVGIDAWMTGFCVNTTEIKAKNLPIPTSSADLLKPVYKQEPRSYSGGVGKALRRQEPAEEIAPTR